MTDGEGARKRKPRSLITNSPHREDYERLLYSGWTSFDLSAYAQNRYGEKIAPSTFRAYKARKKIVSKPSALLEQSDDESAETPMTDVMDVRNQLIALQMERIGIDVTHERQMNKLFSSTGREIRLLSDLLDAAKTDQQALGMVASPAEAGNTPSPTNEQTQPPQGGHSLRSLYGNDAEKVARHLADVLPIRQRDEEAS